jgi:hypothetical protein
MPSFAANGDIRANVDGREIVFDQPPIIVDGRTLVPVRAVTEALGATVNTDFTGEDKLIYITRGTDTLTLILGSANATVNGEPVILDVPAFIMGDRTMVPIRFISESFNLAVVWDINNRTIRITKTPDTVQPSTTQTPVTEQPVTEEVDERIKERNTKLIGAVRDDDLESAREALENGADANAIYTADNIDIPIIAAAFKNDKMLKLLVENGADVNAPIPVRVDGKEGTLYLLDYFISDGDLEMVQYLLDNGANGDYENYYGKDAYGMAADALGSDNDESYSERLEILLLFGESMVNKSYFNITKDEVKGIWEKGEEGLRELIYSGFYDEYTLEPLEELDYAEVDEYLTLTLQTPFFRTVDAIAREDGEYPKSLEETESYYDALLVENDLVINAFFVEERSAYEGTQSFGVYQDGKLVEGVTYPEFENWNKEGYDLIPDFFDRVPHYYRTGDIVIPMENIKTREPIEIVVYEDTFEVSIYEFYIDDYK